MSLASVHDLRRIAEAVSRLQGQAIRDVEIRADCRLMRVVLEDGRQLLVTGQVDDEGRPRLDVDLLRPAADVEQTQLEVPFRETGAAGARS